MDWGTFVPTLLGGGVSLISSLVVFGLTSRRDRVRRENDEKMHKASLAYQGLAKLGAMFNSVHAAHLTIDEIFKDAEEEGRAALSPGVKVTPLAGLPENSPELDAREIAFLLKSNNGSLYNDVLRFELRCHNAIASLKTFNEMRLQYTEQVSSLILSGAAADFSEDGQQASISIEGAVGAVFSAREGVLNSLIGQIVEQLDETLSLGRAVIPGFQKAANEAFGAEFPVKKIEFGEL